MLRKFLLLALLLLALPLLVLLVRHLVFFQRLIGVRHDEAGGRDDRRQLTTSWEAHALAGRRPVVASAKSHITRKRWRKKKAQR
jgi:hypothetical protein